MPTDTLTDDDLDVLTCLGCGDEIDNDGTADEDEPYCDDCRDPDPDGD